MSNDVLIQQLASLLEVTSDSLSPGTSLSTLDTWDSLAKISLLTVVHEHYGITLEADDLDKIDTPAELTDLIQNRRSAAACR